MTELTLANWTDLFESKSRADFSMELFVVRKSGTPFLLLPKSPSLAATSLSLYPAQTSRAKLAKSLLRAALRLRLTAPLEKATFAVGSREPFARFLAGLVDSPAGSVPEMAVLSGNPRTEARRYIFLLFDNQRRAAFVVKAGRTEAARQLIRHEAAFLHSAPAGTPGLPQLRASFDTEPASAFALDFVAGDSPKPEAWPTLGKLFSSWVNAQKTIRVCDAKVWQTLEPACAADPLFTKLSLQLADVAFHPTIFHGDFAPWNIKVAPREQTWRVLDWERGDLAGIPGWDWFHYVIQSGILVCKQTPEQLLQTIEKLFATAQFQSYATAAGIRGNERLLAIAYLLHLVNVIRPSEGLETNKSLLALLAKRWLAN